MKNLAQAADEAGRRRLTYEALNPSTDVRYGPLLSDNVWYGRIG